MNYETRQKRLRESLAEQGADSLYVTNLTNIRYLCGFTGSSGSLLVGQSGSWFLTDGRYRTQSADEIVGAEIEVYRFTTETAAAVRKAAKSLGTKRVGFEKDHTTVASAETVNEWFEGMEMVPTQGLVEKLRRVKDAEEIDAMRKAAELADEGIAYILGRIEPGLTEKQVALDLEFHMRSAGAEAVSFDLIVAAAERSALPHAHPTDRKVEKGRFLLFDIGCRYDGYCSDLTRTVVVGSADDRHREIYELVARAQAAGLAAVAPGKAGSEVDAAARSVIEAGGQGDAFGHGLGHGVGLEVHEGPGLRSISEDILEDGNVVTVEPGVYIPGWGGVRIEDLVLVTSSGSEVLSKAGNELILL